MRQLKDFQLSELKPNTKYILAVDKKLTIKEFNVFKKELDKWLQESSADKNSFLFIQDATIVELPSRNPLPKLRKIRK